MSDAVSRRKARDRAAATESAWQDLRSLASGYKVAVQGYAERPAVQAIAGGVALVAAGIFSGEPVA